ncbi:hypothetical protein BC830DRAFT_599654 [Chytriomyces sp. MP71]|nr:hypothetical protein BC830DRAFT_599654 [Chytriomyces sp. MP71]
MIVKSTTAFAWTNPANVAVVTGGASGIGRAVTIRLLRDGLTVVAVGRSASLVSQQHLSNSKNSIRRADVLAALRQSIPDEEQKNRLFTLSGDVSVSTERVRLFKHILDKHPNTNILINNAGIQRHVHDLKSADWENAEKEISINFSAPVHLCTLFSEHFKAQGITALVANVTSGLSFVPMASVPVYCGTKAALHSFTWSLRHNLKDTAITVVEIIPPAVDTDLQAPGLHTFGVNVDEYADDLWKRLKEGEIEVGYAMAEKGRIGYRASIGPLFDAINNRAH